MDNKWTSISLTEKDIEEIVELGHWIIGDVGVKVNPPQSIRAMVRKLQAIKKDEESGR
jgi:hypothetical protein